MAQGIGRSTGVELQGMGCVVTIIFVLQLFSISFLSCIFMFIFQSPPVLSFSFSPSSFQGVLVFSFGNSNRLALPTRLPDATDLPDFPISVVRFGNMNTVLFLFRGVVTSSRSSAVEWRERQVSEQRTVWKPKVGQGCCHLRGLWRVSRLVEGFGDTRFLPVG